MKPYPTIRRSGMGAQRAITNRLDSFKGKSLDICILITSKLKSYIRIRRGWSRLLQTTISPPRAALHFSPGTGRVNWRARENRRGFVSQPGVERKNESMARNMPAPPNPETFADQCRTPTRKAIETSTAPGRVERCRTVKKPYIQLINGLCAAIDSRLPGPNLPSGSFQLDKEL